MLTLGEDARDEILPCLVSLLEIPPHAAFSGQQEKNHSIITITQKSLGSSSPSTTFLLHGANEGSFTSWVVSHEVGEVGWEVHGLWDGIKEIGAGAGGQKALGSG